MSLARRKFGAKAISMPFTKDDQLSIIENLISDTDLCFDQAKVEKGVRKNSRRVYVELWGTVQHRCDVHFDGASNVVESNPCTKY